VALFQGLLTQSNRKATHAALHIHPNVIVPAVLLIVTFNANLHDLMKPAARLLSWQALLAQTTYGTATHCHPSHPMKGGHARSAVTCEFNAKKAYNQVGKNCSHKAVAAQPHMS